MKLTIEHLAAYLPYEVNMTRNGFVGKLLTIKLPKETDIYDGTEFQVSCSNWWENTTDANHYKPLLRPLSDLTKEIEHNGERFFPASKMTTHGFHNDFWNEDEFDYRYLYALDYQKLLSWHFDIFGLIELGLAIPIKPIDLAKQYYTQTYHAFKGELIQDEIGNLIPKNHGK